MKPTLLHAVRSAIVFAVAICTAGASHAQSYQFVDLGSGQALGINDAGTVVGSFGPNAALWNNGVMSLLYQGPVTSNISTYAVAINNQGQILGNGSQHGNPFAVVWSPSSYTSNFDYLHAPGNYFTVAYGINDKGVIVGDSGGYPAMEFAGSTATGTILNFPNGYSDAANGINNSGVVVGDAYSVSADNYVAVEWKNGSPTVLPGLGNGQSTAYGINDAGTVVGKSNWNGGVISTAAEWSKGNVITLEGYGGKTSQANAINNAGLAVGFSTNPAGTDIATLWRGTTAIDLNHVLSPAAQNAGWTLTDATGINNNGWIVGEAYNYKTHATDGFLLEVSPVPEADTTGMLLGGLGLLCAITCRKRGLRGGAVQ